MPTVPSPYRQTCAQRWSACSIERNPPEDPLMSELVTTTDQEHFTSIVMDDGKANALCFDMLQQLNAALDQAQQAAKVVVISGRPGKFSAGFDLSVMGRMDDATVDLLRQGAGLSRRLLNFDTPVIAAATGHALAMGALMLLSVDYRIGVQGNYKLGLNEVAIGMTLPHFGVELARARLSRRHLNAAVSLARVYDGAGAVDAGFLDEAVEPDQLTTHAAAVAEQFAALSMEAHKGTKQRQRSEWNEALDAALVKDFASH
jgi:enoyl-CoA hydratase